VLNLVSATNIGTLDLQNPEEPIKLIFDGPTLSSLKSLPSLSDITKAALDGLQSSLYNTNFNPSLDLTNKNRTKSNNQEFTEQTKIEYSTGVYKNDVNYTYIYVTEYVKNLIDSPQESENKGDFRDAIDKLNEALKLDPYNNFIKEKLDELKKLSQIFSSQPILEFLLQFVSLPLKVTFGIIQYIMDQLKSFTNPFELPSKIIDLISFKWMEDFFDPTNPNSMFKMAGLFFDFQTFLTVWIPSLESKTKTSFDLNDIMKFPWVQSLPTYNYDQFKSLVYGVNGSSSPRILPLQVLNSILKLVESIINGFIDFIWSLLGLDAIISRDKIHIRLSKNNNDNLSAVEIADILSGGYKDSSNSNYNFIYEIKTSDGRDIRELNREELEKWISENKNVQFSFQF
jgi:hypothetical protein